MAATVLSSVDRNRDGTASAVVKAASQTGGMIGVAQGPESSNRLQSHAVERYPDSGENRLKISLERAQADHFRAGIFFLQHVGDI
jgi:hypothetical protein